MTVIVPALDEEAVIERKITDIRSQNYPAEKLQLVVVADGSQDRTVEIASTLGVECLWERERRGKSAAINRGMEVATGEITCLTDANCAMQPGALAAITARFSDPAVGIVSGAKTVSGEGGRGLGEGLYWRFESMVKAAESNLGVTMGAPGELLGIRTKLFRPLPDHVINDDFYLTCDVLDRGYAAEYASEALTTETTSASAREEFGRRARIAAGTWQTSFEFVRLAQPRRGWVAVSFLSHRLLRNIAVPVLLPLIWLLSRYLGRTHGLGRALSGAQGVAYGAATVGLATNSRILAPFSEFLLLNAAQLLGGYRWLTGSQTNLWQKPTRERWA